MKPVASIITLCVIIIMGTFQSCTRKSVTVPASFDHNRMLVDAELQRKDGTWKKVRLWVDTGNPVFSINAGLADDLGIEFPDTERNYVENLKLKIGGMLINTDSIPAIFQSQPFWLFSSMHCDGNLPSTIFKKYDIVLDYPGSELTIALPGTLKHSGIKSDVSINPGNGIVQIAANLDGDSLSFALDNGASFSFISMEYLTKYSADHPEWPKMTGTAGCANMWGWWPSNEQQFFVVRVDEMSCGNIMLDSFGLAGVPDFGPEGPSLGEWYSAKTSGKVCGFLGANILKEYRIEIDYENKAVYFEKDPLLYSNDMDIVGISMRQLPDSTFEVTGIVNKEGKPVIEGIKPGDIIISIDGFNVKGETMGKVSDALRGVPGELKKIVISENGSTRTVDAGVMRLL